jgi:hypothetical protein
MNFQKFTIKSQEAVQNAQEIASSYNNQAIEPEHLLAALVQDSEGVVVPILQKLGANLNYIKIKVNEAVEKLPKISGAGLGNLYVSQPLGQVFESALKEAEQLKDEYVSTEHLLLALVREAAPLVRHLLPGTPEETIRREVEKRVPPSSERVPTNLDLPLSAACKNVLTRAAQEAARLEDKHIGTEHLLLGLLGQEKSCAAKVLADFGLTPARARKVIAKATPKLRTGWGEASTAITHFSDPGLPAHSTFVPDDIPPEQGARWGAGYVRKTQLMGRMFHWERQPCFRRDALRHRERGQVRLYAGQPYDAAEFELLAGGWTHDHCVVCWRELMKPNDPEQSFGYTNGQDWLCPKCYEIFVAWETKS